MKPLLTVLLTSALACAGAAQAGPPSPANCTIPSHITLVGRFGALGDTATGTFVVVVRDLANNPEPHATVELRLLNCSGARVASESYQATVGIRCETHGVTAVSDAQGVARFAAVGGGTAGSAPGGGACANIYANGVLLGTTSVAYADLDGEGGVAIADLGLWLQDLALQEPISRSDFDGDGNVSANDLSVWLGFYGSGLSYESARAYCP